MHGYSGKDDIDDEDTIEETRIIDEDFRGRKENCDIKSVDLCCMLDDMLLSRAENNRGNSSTSKVTSAVLHEYNKMLVENHQEDRDLLLKYLQQERLYKMMKAGDISNDRALWHYLKHFAKDRGNKIEQLSSQVQPSHDNEIANSNYDADFLRDYFKEDAS